MGNGMMDLNLSNQDQECEKQHSMEDPPNPAFTQYMMERTAHENESLASNCAEMQEREKMQHMQQMQQLELEHQKLLEHQQRACKNQTLAVQLGGIVLPSRQTDLSPMISSMQLN